MENSQFWGQLNVATSRKRFLLGSGNVACI